MSVWLASYGLFLAKTLTLVLALGAVLLLVTVSVRAARGHTPQRLRIHSLSQRLEATRDLLEHEILDSEARKKLHKQRRHETRQRHKAIRHGAAPRPCVFVLAFDGDVQASQAESLREEVTALLQVAGTDDEVVVKLTSPGGVVPGYGLAAAQLTRIRERGIRLTVAIDKVAASGGYMMACVAHQILAAPFAVVGSIGVVAQIPNFNRVLKKHDVDLELHTAGEHKRTLTLFGENTEEGRAKFREELEQVHTLFKHFVSEYRPGLAIDEVATGEHWYGAQALKLKLVDRLVTVDDYLMERAAHAEIYQLEYRRRRAPLDALLRPAASLLQKLLGRG